MNRTLAIALIAGTSISAARAQDTQWNNAAGGSWNNAANWNPMNIPDSAGERAIIAQGGSYTVSLAASVLVGRLWISNPAATLAINNNVLLAIPGPEFTNEGVIIINPTGGGNGTYIRIDADLTLDGAGEIRLHANPANFDTAYLERSGTAVLTQGPSHRIRGRGNIRAAFVNNGSVYADEADLSIGILNTTTNNALMTATNGAFLDLGAVGITQGAVGRLVSDAGSVRFIGTTLTGGTVTSSGGGVSQVFANSARFDSVTQNGDLEVQRGNALLVQGSGLTNNGTITVNPTAGGNATYIEFDADGALGGTGAVVLNASPANLNTAYVTRLGGAVYTNGAEHTIRGTGRVHGAMVNDGTIHADQDGKVLDVVASPTTNHALITATSASTLFLSGNTVNNSGGRVVADGATVNFNATNFAGGQVSIVNAGIARVVSPSTFADVAISGPLEINNNAFLAVAGSGLTHTGTITVNPSAGGNGTYIRFDADGSLAGPGAVVLNANPGNLDTAYVTRLGGVVYTNSAAHTIRGTGRVYGAVVNDGTIHADQDDRILEIVASPTTNHALITATSASTLFLSGNTVNNSGGRVVADGATVNFNGTSLSGGQVDSVNAGIARVVSPSTFADVAISGPLEIRNNAFLAVAGSGLTNNGTITVNPSAGGNATYIRFDADGSLAGPGAVVLNASPANLDTAYVTRLGGVVYTNSAAHTIRGTGRVYGAVVNEGTINADRDSALLDIQASPTTNRSLITATNGGTLYFSGNTVNNTAGRVVADGATVNFNATTLTGGRVDVVNIGIARVVFPSTFTDVTVNGALEINNNTFLVVTGAGLTHTGTITVNPSAGGNATYIRFDTDGSLAGPGAVVLNANRANFDTAYLTTAGSASLTNAPGHTIAGTGRLYGNFINLGRLAPGTPDGGTGHLRREGTYAATPGSIHALDLAGTVQGTTYDLFSVSGAVTLAGTLEVSLGNGYIPAAGTVFDIIVAPSITGQFATVNLPALPHTLGYARLQYTPTAVKVRIPICPSDWNGDGTSNSQDFFDFLADFFSDNSDFNFDGVTNSQDFFDFLTSFFGGCTE